MQRCEGFPEPRRALPYAFHGLTLLVSFPAFLCSCLVLLVTCTVRNRFNDPDLWWHLRIGQIIWTTHRIPTADLFSYTTSRHARPPVEWLTELSLYAAYQFAGYTGLMLWLCFFASLLLLITYATLSLYSGNSKTAFGATLLVWFFATSVFSVRPQLAGFCLLAVELLILECGRTRDRRWIWALPPLFAFWVNVHSTFALGLAVLAMSCVASWLPVEMSWLRTLPWSRMGRRALTVALGLSLLTVWIGPGGLAQVTYAWNTLVHQGAVLRNVSEWQPPTLADPRGAGILIVLAVIALQQFLTRTATLYTQELFFLAAGAWLACQHARMAVVFGLLISPLFARSVANVYPDYDSETDLPRVNALLIATAVGLSLAVFPGRGNLQRQFEAGNPVGAVTFIRSHHFSGNMFNAFDFGGFLIWALPERPVFIDGRADVFDWSGVMQQTADWSDRRVEPHTLLDHYAVSFCVVEPNSPAAAILAHLQGWRPAYSDSQALIFVRTQGS